MNLDDSIEVKPNSVLKCVPISCYLTDPYYFERSGMYIGQGTTMMSRAGMFRVSKGVAVDMKNRVYELPPFHSKIHLFSNQYIVLYYHFVFFLCFFTFYDLCFSFLCYDILAYLSFAIHFSLRSL